MGQIAFLEPESIIIPVNGIHLHAKLAGPENGPLVILLHGFPDFWYGWRNQIAPLTRAGYRVLVPDQRGYNLSDKPKAVSAYSIEKLAEDILSILTFFGKEKAVIAGHDWGAAVAWYLGMIAPQVIERLMIVNVPHLAAFNRALQKPMLKQLRKSTYIFYFQIPFLPEQGMRRNNYAQLKKTLLHSSLPGTFQASDLDQYEQAWSQPGALSGGINWYRAMGRKGLELGQEKYNRQFERKIIVPTLVLWGDQDAFLEPFLADWSMDWVEQGKIIHFANAGHWVLQEKPDEVNQAILQYLAT
jgi:epoxide hydrolase 4